MKVHASHRSPTVEGPIRTHILRWKHIGLKVHASHISPTVSSLEDPIRIHILRWKHIGLKDHALHMSPPASKKVPLRFHVPLTSEIFKILVVGLSRLTLRKVVSRGRAHGDSAYKLGRTFSWKSSHPGKHMGIPK